MELDRAFEGTLAVLGKVQREQFETRTPCTSRDIRAGESLRWYGARAVSIAESGEVNVADYVPGFRCRVQGKHPDGDRGVRNRRRFGEGSAPALRQLPGVPARNSRPVSVTETSDDAAASAGYRAVPRSLYLPPSIPALSPRLWAPVPPSRISGKTSIVCATRPVLACPADSALRFLASRCPYL